MSSLAAPNCPAHGDTAPAPASPALDRIRGFAAEMTRLLPPMDRGTPGDMEGLEAAVDARLMQLHADLVEILGHIRHLLGEPLDLTFAPEGTVTARGPFGTTAQRVVDAAVNSDPMFCDALAACEAAVRALALAGAAAAADDAARAAPDQADSLWQWLNGRVAQIRSATFTFRMARGEGCAFLVDAAGHPLTDWRRPWPVALSGAVTAA